MEEDYLRMLKRSRTLTNFVVFLLDLRNINLKQTIDSIWHALMSIWIISMFGYELNCKLCHSFLIP